MLYLFQIISRVELDEVEEPDCIDIQPGKENREPYTFITQVFRTLNQVAR